MVNVKQVNEFQHQGVLLIRGAFKEWVGKLQIGVESVMSSPSERERSYQPDGDDTPFFQDYCNWELTPEFRDFVYNSPASSIAASLMRSKSVQFFHDHVLVKEPGSTVATPWHQDSPYYCVKGDKTVSFWTPLDNISRSVAIEFVVGSHLWGEEFRPLRFDGSSLFEMDSRDEIPDIDSLRTQNSIDVVGYEMEPGDTIAFDYRTIHGAPANTGNQSRRRAFSSRWFGDNAWFDDSCRLGSPPFPEIDLSDRDSPIAPEFPFIITP